MKLAARSNGVSAGVSGAVGVEGAAGSPGTAAVAHAASMNRIVKLKALIGCPSSDAAGACGCSAGTGCSVSLPEEIGSDFNPSMADSFSTTLAKALEALPKPYDASDGACGLFALAARTIGILAHFLAGIAQRDGRRIILVDDVSLESSTGI